MNLVGMFCRSLGNLIFSYFSFSFIFPLSTKLVSKALQACTFEEWRGWICKRGKIVIALSNYLTKGIIIEV